MSDDDFQDDFELPDDDVDMGDIPDSDDPEPGTYLVTVEKMQMKGRTDDPNTKYINIQFKILDVLDERLEGFIGRSLFDIYNLGNNALWKIKGVWAACRGKENVKGNRIPNLTGDKLKLNAYIDIYQGDERLRTKNYKSAEGWSGITMDLTDVDDDEDEGEEEQGQEQQTKKRKSSAKSKGSNKSEDAAGSTEVEI